ncbi:MAG TPA: lytic transglycosylase domain-containing protein [Macromonas sp.]|nr:lytic transglycosylase domain-containing protein [Macromonas sp.]
MTRRFRLLRSCFGLALAGFSSWLVAAELPEPPEWTDEAPLVSRLIEEGYAAQIAHAPVVAATRYCAAARHGSVEAQFRLGRMYLDRSDATGRQEGRALLALAAQRGNVRAQTLLGTEPVGDSLPDCLYSGTAPVFSMADDPFQLVVPVEVVERFVLSLPGDKRRYAQMIQRLAPGFSVDGRLALAIARAESNFDPAAVSPRNAQGLMQLIPGTAERFGVRNAMDPVQNVRGGLAYLRFLLARFNGDVALTSAAYNAGEGAVDRYGGIPPFPETRDYVQRILRFYRSPTHARPSAM